MIRQRSLWLFVAFLAGCSAAEGTESDSTTTAATAEDDLYATNPGELGPAPSGQMLKTTEYRKLSTHDKQEVWWSAIQGTAYAPDALPNWKSSGLKLIKELVTFRPNQRLEYTFSAPGDEMPEGRFKALRPAGTVAKVSVELDYPAQSPEAERVVPYSGLLAPNAGKSVVGLARLSDNGISRFNPAFALKLFVDGRTAPEGSEPSENALFAHSMDGMEPGHRNFFEEPICTRLPPPHRVSSYALWAVFRTVKKDPGNIPVDNLSWRRESGETVTPGEFNVPDRLCLVPHGAMATRFANDARDYRAYLQDLKAGDVIYDVVAYASDTAPGENIGVVRLTSTPVASEAGDSRLFFRHYMRPGEATF